MSTDEKHGIVAGLDGCPGGWIVALHERRTGHVSLERIEGIGELFARHPALDAVAIDMPIGLPERVGPRGRTPERLVRPLLGQRQSSVFSVPSRSAIYAAFDESVPEAERYRHCCAVARDTSAEAKAVARQAFGIFPKIVALDGFLRANPQCVACISECHPEVSFWAMNARTPLAEPKKIKQRVNPAGLALRHDLLQANGLDSSGVTGAAARAMRAGLDDLIDACAACWTAARIADGVALSFPDPPDCDALGLPIAIRA